MTQYRLVLEPDRPCSPAPEWAYPLYAALLAQAPSGFAGAAHEDAVTPMSQFLTVEEGRPVWTVTLLGEACEEALSGTLERLETIPLHRERVTLAVRRREAHRVADVEALFAQSAGHDRWRLEFCSPVAFKSRGRYQTLPSSRLVIQSLIQKWNGSVKECPIEDPDGQGLEALAAGLTVEGFSLHSRLYHMKGRPIPGCVGYLELENRLTGFHRELTDALLLFSGYAGLGIKTTLGMGGVIVK